MAAKKTEEMTEEVKVGETTEEVKAEAKPEENPDERVNIYLMRDSDKYKGDVFVQVNGVGYIIQRGKNVKVPKAVAEVLQNSQEQDSRTAELIDQETEKFEKLLPIVAKYGAMFILLPLSDAGLPKDIEEKKEIIHKIYDRALSLGMRKEDIVVDGLVATVGANPKAALETLETIRYCKSNGFATICGLSNICHAGERFCKYRFSDAGDSVGTDDGDCQSLSGDADELCAGNRSSPE